MPEAKLGVRFLHELIGKYDDHPAWVVGNGISSTFYDTWRWRNSGNILIGCNIGFKKHPLDVVVWQDTVVEKDCLMFKGIRITPFRKHMDPCVYNGVYVFWGGQIDRIDKYTVTENRILYGSSGAIALQVACIMGCNPIYLVGCDCAFVEDKDGKFHSNIFKDKQAIIANKNPDKIIRKDGKATTRLFMKRAKQYKDIYDIWEDSREIWLADGGIGIVEIPRKEPDKIFWTGKHPGWNGRILDGEQL